MGGESNENIGTIIPGSVEALAVEQGWAPPGEYEGREGRPELSATDFLRKGLDIRKGMKKRLENTDKTVTELKTTMQNLVTHQAKKTQHEISKEREKWEQEKNDAIDDKDRAGVTVADEKLKELDKEESELKTAATSQPEKKNTPVYEAWHKKNEWYETDQLKTDVALGEAGRFHEANPGHTEQQMLDHVAQHINEKFPTEQGGADLDITNTNTTGKTAPDPVTGARRRTTGSDGANGAALVGKMTPEQKEVAASFVSAGIVNPKTNKPMTVADYAQDLSEIGEIK